MRMSAFRKPGAPRPVADTDGGEPVATMAPFNPRSHLDLARQRRLLPVYGARDRFLHAVESHGCVVVTAETGSGKSTQLPQFLVEAGWAQRGRMVCCTQPRRVAATTLAARVAEEAGCRLGQEVGFAVRFEEQWVRGTTRLKYVTDGLLLREAMSDPELRAYSVVVVDEAHERGMQTDVLLGILRRVRAVRPELRVVVTSATIDAERFRRFFDGPRPPDAPSAPRLPDPRRWGDAPQKPSRWGTAADDPSPSSSSSSSSSASSWRDRVSARAGRGTSEPSRAAEAPPAPEPAPRARDPSGVLSRPPASAACVLAVSGRAFPVDVQYAAEPPSEYLRAAADAALAAHKREPPGDILVFVPGADEVDWVCRALRDGAPAPEGGYGRDGGATAVMGTARFAAMAAGRRHERAGVAQADDGVDWPAGRELEVCPLHAKLPWSDQLRALRPGRVISGSRRVRKVVVATSVAETSITLPGVTVVVDSGFTRGPAYDPDAGVSGLVTRPVSAAQAKQRAGRAGRVRPGKCLRLYTAATARGLELSNPPDLLCAPLSSMVLQLLALGVTAIGKFRFLDPPPAASVVRALDELATLRAVEPRTPPPGRAADAASTDTESPAGAAAGLTWRGRWLAQLPVPPHVGGMLLASLGPDLHCAEECLSLAAMLASGSPFADPPREGGRGRQAMRQEDDGDGGDGSFHRFLASEGDHLTLVNAFDAWEANGRRDGWCAEFALRSSVLRRAGEVRSLLRRTLGRLLAAGAPYAGELAISSCGGDGSLVLRAVVRGAPLQLASLGRGGAYVTLSGSRSARLRDTAVLSRLAGDAGVPPWVVFDSVLLSPGGALLLGPCSSVDPRWAMEAAPERLALRERDPARRELAMAANGGDEDKPLDEAAVNAAVAAILRGDESDSQRRIADAVTAGTGRAAATKAASTSSSVAQSAGLDGVAAVPKRARLAAPAPGGPRPAAPSLDVMGRRRATARSRPGPRAKSSALLSFEDEDG